MKNLWLLPSSIDLVAADTELPKLEDAHHVMKRIVDAVRERFDYIFIDCSPSLGYTTVNILTAADTVLIPVQCEYLALEGLSKLLNTIRKVKSGLNPALDIEGFLLTMYMRNRLNNQVVNEVREHFGPLAYDTIIQRNIRLGEAPSHGKPVMLYDAGAVGSENYLTLAREFLKRNRKPRKITYRNETTEGIRARTGRHIRHRRRRRQAQADEPDVRDRHHGDHSQPHAAAYAVRRGGARRTGRLDPPAGVIQPITVKKSGDGKYIIISGERRWRATQRADLTSLPAYIREVDDENLHAMALVENIQRQDLNAIEIALGMQRLIDECNLTQDALSEKVGKKRSTISNYMRLLKLPDEVQLALKEGLISMGHAKAIAGAPDGTQVRVLKRIIKKGLSVRQAEELVRSLTEQPAAAAQNVEDEEYPESYSRLVEQLEKFFSQDISIKRSKNGGGRIVIGFGDDKDIEQFIERFSDVLNNMVSIRFRHLLPMLAALMLWLPAEAQLHRGDAPSYAAACLSSRIRCATRAIRWPTTPSRANSTRS